jgi:uncharacterized protein (DUF1800 family)
LKTRIKDCNMSFYSPVQLVSRAGIRAGEDDKARLEREGWAGWVSSQLALPSGDNSAVGDALSKSTLRIEYDAGDGYAAVKEDRNFTSLRKPTRELWHLLDWNKRMAYAERERPGEELLAATLIRATLSDAQLRESVVDFWRDHFAVNIDSVEDVAVALPTYDQDVLRVHALGNFRELLEAVATSTSMLAYLDNASSRASPANENYARELMELHGLGADVYLHAVFDKWRDVPGALDGKPEGFIDQDVYEAARAFTGWTYESGQWVSEGNNLPRTGEFFYHDAWHDPYQKRILGVEFESHAAPMADGRKVLDLVAFHPATARYISKRLCRRFVSDAPTVDLINATASLFIAHHKSKDQLAKVIEFILLSDEFQQAQPRLQRPMFLFASMQRNTNTLLPPSRDHIWLLEGMGQKLYGWPSPSGHPMASRYWQSPGFLVRRWRGMAEIWRSIMQQIPDQEWPTIASFAETWSGALGLDDAHRASVASLIQKEQEVDDKAMTFAENERWPTSQALATLTASPAYQSV